MILAQQGHWANGLPKSDELLVKLEEDLVLPLVAQFMIEFRVEEGRLVLGVRRLASPAKRGKLLSPSAAYGLDQCRVRMTDKVGKRRCLTVLFAHK